MRICRYGTALSAVNLAVLKLPGSEETDVAAGWSRVRMWSWVDGLDVEQDQARGDSVQVTPWIHLCLLCDLWYASLLHSFFHTLAWIHQMSIEVTSNLVCCELSVNLVSSLQTNLAHPQLFFFLFGWEHLQKVSAWRWCANLSLAETSKAPRFDHGKKARL